MGMLVVCSRKDKVLRKGKFSTSNNAKKVPFLQLNKGSEILKMSAFYFNSPFFYSTKYIFLLDSN